MSAKRTFKFTDQALKGLPIPPKPQQLDYFDAKTRGLGLRVSYGGRKTFFAMYSNNAGKRQRVSLGEYGRIEDGRVSLGQASKKAKAKLGEVAKDRDPAAEVRAVRAAPTVKVLAADFIAMQRKRGKKSAGIQERRLARAVLPILGDRKARALTRADIKSIMIDITERGAPIEANRVHEVIRTMLNYGLEEETYGLESNPADRLGKHRNPEPRGERALSLDEIADYWRALEYESASPATALQLCLLVGQRQQNVLGMRRNQLLLADRLWLIPASTTKTGKPNKVPLSQAAIEIIEARLAEVDDQGEPKYPDWIFPNRRTGEGPAGLTFLGKPHRSACKRAKIMNYTPHAHRRTFGRHCDAMGIPRLVWDGILGHVRSDMADLYSGFDFAEQRLDCMEKWADRIAAALGENVVSLDLSRDKPA